MLLTPMRWPGAWQNPSSLDILKDTPIDFLLLDGGGNMGAVATRARELGLTVSELKALPSDVTLVEGSWPGVKLTEAGAVDSADAGPTGDPWVDSNGWQVQLAAAQHPGNQIWISAMPTAPRLFPESYVTAVCDVAAAGGRWVITLDDALAAGISARKPESMDTWRKIADAAAFFKGRKDWNVYLPKGFLGIVSDFTGDNEFFSHEILNLVARTNQQYKAVLVSKLSPEALNGLKAVLYASLQPPSPEIRKQLLAFVENGGTLIAGPAWGPVPGSQPASEPHKRYEYRTLGKGRLALATAPWDDPWLVAQDSPVLISHRFDLVRFWNGGATSPYLGIAADGKRALLQVVFYVAARAGDPTAWVAGRYKTAKLYTLNQTAPRSIDLHPQTDGVEVYLSNVSQYAAVELEG